MESNFAGILGVILFILGGILGFAHQPEISFICIGLSFYLFWVSSRATK